MRAFDEYNPPAYNLDVYSEVLLGFQVYDGLVYTEYQMTASEVRVQTTWYHHRVWDSIQRGHHLYEAFSNLR